MSWQNELRKSIQTLEQLKRYVKFTRTEEKQVKKVIERHPMRITRYYMSLIDQDDPFDPLRKMIVPSVEELNLAGSYDPSNEKANTIMPGIQHKYPQTVLILATNRCAGYCRYCFRKRLVGLGSQEILRRLSSALKYIEEHEEVNNVLISGGDPFMLPTRVIRGFLEELSSVRHLNFIRFGTRTPAMFPDRFLEDEELLAILQKYSKKTRRIYVVTQFNHPREITDRATDAVSSLIKCGVVLNNQTVLLKGVNDDGDVLGKLQKKLVSIGVIPYYVFQCRPVKRVKHQFQVTLRRGYEVVEEAKAGLDGHSKRFRYVMSHLTGKIEVVGVGLGEIYLKYHQAKDAANLGRLFTRKLGWKDGWLENLKRSPSQVRL